MTARGNAAIGRQRVFRAIAPTAVLVMLLAASCGVPQPDGPIGMEVGAQPTGSAVDSPTTAPIPVTTSPVDAAAGGPKTVAPIVQATKSPMSLQEAITASEAGLDPGMIRSVTLASVPGDGPTLNVTVNVPNDTNGAAVLGEWEAQLLVGAVADRATATGPTNRSIAMYNVISVDASGKTIDNFGFPLNPILAGAQFASTELSDASIMETARAITTRHGWKLVSARVLHPLDPALAVVVQLPAGSSGDMVDKVGTWEKDMMRLGQTLPTGTCALEGMYAEVQDNTGRVLSRFGFGCRTPDSSSWYSSEGPQLAPHGGPPPSHS